MEVPCSCLLRLLHEGACPVLVVVAGPWVQVAEAPGMDLVQALEVALEALLQEWHWNWQGPQVVLRA